MARLDDDTPTNMALQLFGSTSYETIPHVRLETSGGILSTVDMVVQRDGRRRLRELDDDDNDDINAAIEN